MGRNCIYFLCHRPSAEQLSFYQSFCEIGYDVAVVVDDISWPISILPQLHVIRMSDEDCMAAGFMGVNPAIRKPLPVSAWDKALCDIHQSEKPFSHVWLIEDDVLIPSPAALVAIDCSHPTADLVTASSTVFRSADAWPGPRLGWMWFDHMPKRLLPLPWAHGMVCAVRLSERLAQEATSFLRCHAAAIEQQNCRRQRLSTVLSRCRLPQAWVRRLGRPQHLFIEYLFHTLATHAQMEIATPEELSTVLWRHCWQPDAMLHTHFYHPVKNLEDHPHLRALVDEARR